MHPKMKVWTTLFNSNKHGQVFKKPEYQIFRQQLARIMSLVRLTLNR